MCLPLHKRVSLSRSIALLLVLPAFFLLVVLSGRVDENSMTAAVWLLTVNKACIVQRSFLLIVIGIKS